MSYPFLFDPTQFKEFGMSFFEGNEFSCRYQLSDKKIWKALYIPFGPNCETENGFENFISWVNGMKFSRVTIDLPLILHEEIQKKIKHTLFSNGFTPREYIQDDETMLVKKEQFSINSKNRRYIKLAKNTYSILIKDSQSITEPEKKRIYEIYLESAVRIGFEPKTYEAFQKLFENCIVSLAQHMETGVLDGYVFGYQYYMPTKEKDLSLLQIFSTATTNTGRDAKLGYALHYDLFEEAFLNRGIEVIDFHGASRKKGRSYVEFKTVFGGDFYPHGGSYERVKIF